MVNYQKNRWNNYDPSKTFSENLENDAIMTLEKALHIEQGIYDANRAIEIGEVRIADENETPKISVRYNTDSVVMNFVLPRSTVSKDDTAKIIDASKQEFVKLFSRIYVGNDESITPNNNDVMFILSENGQSIEGIRTFYNNVDGTVTHTDLKLHVDITDLVTDDQHLFITQEERDKLSSIERNANNYVHPTGDGNLHVPATGTENNNKVLRAGGSPGEIKWDNLNRDDVVNALGYTPVDNKVVDGSTASSTKPGLLSPEMFNKINNIEEGANNYVHPDSHPANMIVETPEKEFISEEEKSLLYYNNSNPTLVAHGGIEVGTTFNNKSIREIIGNILYPYIQPTASCSVVTPSNGGTFEVGAGTIISSVKVLVTKKSENITKVELFATDDINTVIASQTEGVANGGTFTFSINKSINDETSNLKLRAKVTDASGTSITTDSGAFNTIYPMFYGAIDKGASLTSDLIKSLTKLVQTKGNKSLTFTANNQCLAFAYPASYGSLTSIIDPNNFNVTSTFTKYSVSLSLGGLSKDYFVYVNEASTVSGFTVSFKY